ncbi:HAD family hydrolase [Sphingorhabdus sp. Alg239-R122]|uniref:sulfotransferase-like domain-containing protein n=1 Tax=Sphingorhabdus sp. Alg239-R122 TaxID=2305989 RepID=UPI001F07FAEC|nr:HAD family hydrolase [Sphingorhabdus sp. Alg239-R122]
MTQKTVRIAMWSGPRNISTAMMRSFGARKDTCVSDEPFYGAYLKQTGIKQPMFREIIEDMDCNWQTVHAAMNGALPEGGKSIWYQKHMPFQMTGPYSILDFPKHRHAFLIRDPAYVIASYAAKRIEVSASDLGYEKQWDYVQYCCDRDGEVPAIFDSVDILAEPEAMLCLLCQKLGIPWDSAMLNWKAGYRDTDGIWASHWYNQVIETTGFSPGVSKPPVLDSAQQKINAECQPFYEKMALLKMAAAA